MAKNYEYMCHINSKLSGAESLTDEELKLALTFYRDLEGKLATMGLMFHLSWEKVFRKLSEMEGWMNARKEHRKEADKRSRRRKRSGS